MNRRILMIPCAQYLGAVYSIDRNVDRVLKGIDELGIRDSTIFVFSPRPWPRPNSAGSEA